MTHRMGTLSLLGSALSPGAWVLLVLALGSTLIILRQPEPRAGDIEMWTFARVHAEMYAPILERANADRPERAVRLVQFSLPVLERRMLSAFLSGTPAADLLEVERALVGRAFLGPPELIGFQDLTERIDRDGLRESINPPSFSPWMNRRRIYGLPHDVHPVMLGYRSDIVEAAGIDVSQIETWDDFIRVMAPLMRDADGDGEPDHYLLGIWETDAPKLESLMLQAGGGYFAEDGSLALATETNARVLATVIDWITGPDRIADDVPDFTGSGNQLKVDGHAIAYLMPDWMCAIWRIEIPQLRGKVKVMPLPAWERGGRRTSVWGGTMLGLSRNSPRLDDAWEAAKELYLSRELAHAAYRGSDLISPVTDFWSDPIYDEPDPYFSGQPKGRMYIDLAPDIPRRVSSPYHPMVEQRLREVAVAVARYARSNPSASRADLETIAMQELRRIEADVQRWMDRNAFLGGAD